MTPQTDFTFRYESTGVGCSTVKIAVGEQSVEFDATYIGPNPLGDFMEAISEIVDGNEDEIALSWSDEPGSLQLEMQVKDQVAYLVVKESPDLLCPSEKEGGQWTKRIDAIVDFNSVVKAIVKEADRNLKLHGIAGFSDDWMIRRDVFPMSAYLKLKGIKSEYEKGDDYRKSSPLDDEIKVLLQLTDIRVETESFTQTLIDLERQCKALSKPILNRLGWRIVKKIGKQMVNNNIDEDFAALGLSFFDQLSIYYQSRTYDEMMFGFGDYIDDLIDSEIDTLTEEERMILENRDLHALSAGEMPARIFSDLKNEFSSIVDQHYYTTRIQRFVDKYDLHN